jgi:purine-binding chemotaxis protein CheW
MSIYEGFSEQELEILQARAERAANATLKSDAGETLTTLQLMLGSEAYALPVTALRAVYENVTVVPVPCTPPFVAGIANIRGRIMPVLDLAVLLNAPRGVNDVSPALVVVSREDFSLVFQVEGVGDIATFPASSVDPLSAGGDTIERASYLQGMLADGSILLNVNAILGDPTLVVNDTLA